MGTPAKLSEILDSMDFQTAESSSYLDKSTGKVILLTSDEMYAAEEGEALDDYEEWERENIETARRIVEDGDESLVPLPSKWDINEYEIMESFCHSLPEGQTRDALCITIKGSGAFRRFKESLHVFDLVQQWYKYRDAEMRTIAIDWCEEYEIPYIDDTKK